MKIGSRLIHFPIYQPKFLTPLRPLINLGSGSLPAKAPVDTDIFFALAGRPLMPYITLGGFLAWQNFV